MAGHVLICLSWPTKCARLDTVKGASLGSVGRACLDAVKGACFGTIKCACACHVAFKGARFRIVIIGALPDVSLVKGAWLGTFKYAWLGTVTGAGLSKLRRSF